MYSRKINDATLSSLSVPQFAEELFALTETNRPFLRKWLPWLDTVKEAKDTRVFLEECLVRFSKGEGLHSTIFQEGRIAGVVGYNEIDRANQIGHIGYWLGEEFNGKGIMTECVKDLIKVGEEFMSLQRIDIRCAVENHKSRAIPERLGFKNEGTLKRAEKVNGNWYDHVVYGLVL